MAETSLNIPSGHITLEAVYMEGKGKDVCVVLHPHPLYGGSMDNNVVRTIQRTLNALGWSTLLYNSRGVGSSGGRYDNGSGESMDLLNVAEFLKEKNQGIRLHVAAYSFGVWVALKSIAEQGMRAASLILVSPPLDFVSFQGLSLPPVPCLVTAGDADEFCSVASLKKWMEVQGDAVKGADLKILPGCDHFYWAHEKALSGIVSRFAQTRVAPSP